MFVLGDLHSKENGVASLEVLTGSFNSIAFQEKYIIIVTLSAEDELC